MISKLYNGSWVRPKPSEVLSGAATVEGCYWQAPRAPAGEPGVLLFPPVDWDCAGRRAFISAGWS